MALEMQKDKAGVIREYTYHFFLDEQKLRKIVDIIDNYSKRLTISTFISFYVEFNDDTFYTTKSIDNILSEDNSIKKQITRLSIRLLKNDNDKNHEDSNTSIVSLAFRKNKVEEILILVSHEDRDWCFLLIDELDAQIQRIKRKKIFGKIKSIILDFIIAFGILGLNTFFITKYLTIHYSKGLRIEQINMLTDSQKLNKILENQINNYIDPWLIPISYLTLIIIFFVIEIKPITKLVSYLSHSVFYWGDIIEIETTYEKKKNIIKITIFLGFIISVLAGLFVWFIVEK